MLDTHRGTGGVLLAGIHELQTNVKIPYFRGQDPWTYAVVYIVTRQSKTKSRAMPTYTLLYKEAKQFIASQMRAGGFDSKEIFGPESGRTQPVAL